MQAANVHAPHARTPHACNSICRADQLRLHTRATKQGLPRTDPLCQPLQPHRRASGADLDARGARGGVCQAGEPVQALAAGALVVHERQALLEQRPQRLDGALLPPAQLLRAQASGVSSLLPCAP